MKKKKPTKIKLKTFLAIYLGSDAGMKKWNKLSADHRKQREISGIQGWMDWAKKAEKSIVDMGGPLGATKRVDRRGIASTRNQMGAYTIVQASSHAVAAKLFKHHPHFMVFPGDSVELMEILPLPEM